MAKEYSDEEKARRKRNTEAYRKTEKYAFTYIKNHLKRTYGISYEEYFELYAKQGNKCAICGTTDLRREFKERSREQFLPLFVDHCHATNKVRGLLCSKCNTGIGMFNDNIKSLENAISYLKDNKA